MNSAPRILVVGSMNMDLVLRVDRIPLSGESYFGSEYHTVPGGKGANQAVAAAKLGAAVTFSGRVGADANGDRLVAGLEEHGIDAAAVVRDREAPTGLAVIIVEPDGANRILVYAGANMRMERSDVEKLFAVRYDAVMINFEIPDEIVRSVVEYAARRSVPVIVDAGPARGFDLGTLRGIEVLSPNETETAALVGIECSTDRAVDEACRELRGRSGAKLVVMKLGSRGAVAFDGSSFTRQGAFEVDAVDSTAAGDAFTAGFAVSRLTGATVAEALRRGAAAGAIAVTRLGAQPSLPTAAEVEAFLAAPGVAPPGGDAPGDDSRSRRSVGVSSRRRGVPGDRPRRASPHRPGAS